MMPQEIAEFTEKWIRSKHGMSFREAWPYIAEAGSYFGDEAIRTGGGEWGRNLEIKRKGVSAIPFRIMMICWLVGENEKDRAIQSYLKDMLLGKKF